MWPAEYFCSASGSTDCGRYFCGARNTESMLRKEEDFGQQQRVYAEMDFYLGAEGKYLDIFSTLMQ